jgi:hypothetical protein
MAQSEQEPDGGAGQTLWRGVDLSGVIVLLGTGTGRLIEMLLTQVSRADGQLLVLDAHLPRLLRIAPLREHGPLVAARARIGPLPLLGDSVDLMVLNGVLREVPESRYPDLFDELWRVLVPGGTLRISDIIEPSAEEYDSAWRERNRLVRRLAKELAKPAAVAVALPAAARALRAIGFEELACTLLPGYLLTDAWLEETINALHSMAARLVDRSVRDELVQREIPRLAAAYALGDQRAAERFVLTGRKVGSLALDMKASFTEDDLLPEQ